MQKTWLNLQLNYRTFSILLPSESDSVIKLFIGSRSIGNPSMTDKFRKVLFKNSIEKHNLWLDFLLCIIDYIASVLKVDAVH